MKLGSLRFTMPNGELFTFGEGNEVHASIQVHSSALFRKGIWYGDVGFGEAYVDGDWDTDDITDVIRWMILNLDNHPQLSGSDRSFRVNLLEIANKLFHKIRSNTLTGSQKNIADHYDLSNEFFRTFLDPGMTYSSAIFDRPEQTLESAQQEKYDRLCRKLQLKPGDHVLEIGTGWGGFALHAAKAYGSRITTVTISQQQFQLAKQRVQEAGLNDRIDVQLRDYRNIQGQFDKLVSIEMLEAVGHRYLEAYFKKCHELLKHDGLMALQVITCPDARYDTLRKTIDWTQKHIFPGSLILSVAAINNAINRTGDLFLHHLEDFGTHYARTLREWKQKFNRNLAEVRTLGFNESFIRKWNYYLSYCEAAFSMRNISVIQMVYTRPNNRNL